MIRSNLLARRVAFAVSSSARSSRSALPSSASAAADALVARLAAASPSASAAAFDGFSIAASRRTFSSSQDPATELGSILQREIEEEDEASAEYEGSLPAELAELDSEVRSKWTVLEGISGIGGASGETGGGATMRMFRKESGSKGAKIGIVFHCQDTEDDHAFDEESFMEDPDAAMESVEEEPSQATRFGVTVSKGGKTVVIQCRVGGTGEVGVEGVVVRDGDAESALAALAGGEGTHAALYQGPEFTELAEDLQESFRRYVVEECGVDGNVAAYISMYADFREQEEYRGWMKTAIDILD